MMRSSLIFVLFSIFIFAFSAQAQSRYGGYSSYGRSGILLEPYIGYSFSGSIDFNSPPSDPEDDFKGFTYGGRLGYQTQGLMFGVDFSGQSTTIEFDGGGELDASRKQLGAFLGYNTYNHFRFWGTYFFNGSAEPDNSNNQFEGASGFALGLGYTGLPHVSINLEYRSINYDEVTAAPVPNQPADVDAKEILLSISLPLYL